MNDGQHIVDNGKVGGRFVLSVLSVPVACLLFMLSLFVIRCPHLLFAFVFSCGLLFIVVAVVGC